MLKVYYEEYRNDLWRKLLEKSFYSLQEIEDWIFGQMRRDFSNKKNGGHAMSFPTSEAAERIKSDGPWEIEFHPEMGGPTYWIHQICDDRGIIFSDGKMTAGKRHWTKEIQAWLTHCRQRQFNPTFDFVDSGENEGIQEPLYICYETMQRMSKNAWENYYNYSGVINKKEYPDFTVWWADMRKSGVIEAVQDKGSKPWHTEVWTDEDLVNALEYRSFPVTSENISKLREACRDLFDDLSGRNEQIDEVCVRLFTPHNTQINYLYRDANNYKVHNHAVVKGEITDTQIKEIMDCLDGGEYFIPSQVGLPEEKFGTETEDDTPWFELQANGFTITDKSKTEPLITVEELVRNFLDAKGNWKEDL